tara:strand:+ start:9687 stop:11732 length:2046 start_codon:yes stop_codon:yes gene_type:complete
MAELKFNSTEDIKISKKMIDQVIGQNEAVNIIKKAAQQRRHVLLIGEPGTGKSMMGVAMAELLPMEKLVDIVSFPNPNDENQPLIRTMPAGQGRDFVAKAKMQSMNLFKNQNIILFIVIIVATFIPYFLWRAGKISDIIYAASIISSIALIGIFILSMNLGRRGMDQKKGAPKVIVDNFKRAKAPFNDATGAHAGALLGDVLHDPFQSFFRRQIIKKIEGNEIKNIEIDKELDKLFLKNNKHIIINKNNYEAIHLPKNELNVLGETHNSISPVEVLSCNRYNHDGKMIKITTSEKNELIVTPEHKVATNKNGEIKYIEAKDIKEGDEVVSKSENIIIDEQDIINTYDERQQELSKSYYNYLKLRKQNPTWGYKKIATKLGVSYGRTRWWWDNNSAPVPIQTANWLRERNLLPLKIDSSKLPIIAKILGATFGDGGIFDNLNGIFLSSSEKNAVKEFGKDIEKTFNLKLNENSRIIEGGEYGHSWCYQNTNRNLIRFFLALGAPKGNKTNVELKVPNWIKTKKEFEDEFYGSFLGGELGTPTIHKQGNYLTSLEVGITGLPKFKNNRIYFLNELANYLKKNRVNTTSIYEGKTINSQVYRLLIEKKIDNVLLFLINLKINYCKYKVDRLYKALGQWAMLKKNKYNELINRGYGAEHAMKVLNLTPNSLYMLLNHFGPGEATT